MRLRALSAETKQQAEELDMWRLASQPAPTLDQFLPNTDNQSETQDQVSAVTQSQSNQQQADDMSQALSVSVEAQAQELQVSPGVVTIVREDDIFLSGSSNKLQGRMLFSR